MPDQPNKFSSGVDAISLELDKEEIRDDIDEDVGKTSSPFKGRHKKYDNRKRNKDYPARRNTIAENGSLGHSRPVATQAEKEIIVTEIKRSRVCDKNKLWK